QLQLELQDIVPKWTYDEARIKQVILNLLSNAIKFSQNNESILIDVSMQDGKNGKILKVSVQDTGEGIPQDELIHIFNKFEQSSRTKSGAGGTGLGLAICKNIIEAHHGKIWAKNNKTIGATFYFTLPEIHKKS
ncbi:MAG: ATP-binding protein, partial [Gammaproteobacteria bacterium]|nr:ATP-binding protein [Gammaproteobacteria bacterium]